MTRKKLPVVAHALLMSMVIDLAVPVRVGSAAPRAALSPSAAFHFEEPAWQPGTSAASALPRAFPRPVAARRLAPFVSQPVQGPAPEPEDVVETPECDAAVASGAAPVTTVARRTLWPATHSLQDIGLAVRSTPVCESLLGLDVEVWADEPDDAPQDDDGATTGDAQLSVPISYVRAERDDVGNGRVYLIITKARTHGNIEGHNCSTVVVPNTGSPADVASALQQAAAAAASCAPAGAAPVGYERIAARSFSAPNRPPLVDAGPRQGVPALTATLDGSASDDGLPDGSLELQWTQASGLGQATFSDARVASPGVTFSAPGVYRLRLTARDGDLEAIADVDVVAGTTNHAPLVNAGVDQWVWPGEAHLHGTATDDDHFPNQVTHIAWESLSSPPGTVTFSDVNSLDTVATFSAPGTYILALWAWDGEIWGLDTVTIVVRPEPAPTITIADGTVTEGHEGGIGGEIHVALSHASSLPVTVDFMTTEEGTATPDCDYRSRFGTLSFAPQQTEQTIVVPVMGELTPESDETVIVRLGNPTGAILATDDRAELSIVNDDEPNAPPYGHAARTPLDGSTGTALPPTLSWGTGDPNYGDTVTSDIFFGTSVSKDGQEWSRSCLATAVSGPRASSAFASDGADLLFALEQEPDGRTGSNVFILNQASGTGATPYWETFPTDNGPEVTSARAAFDFLSDRFLVVGRCLDGCTDGIETWALPAPTFGGFPWRRISTANAPPPRDGFALAAPPVANRLYLFGGVGADGSLLDDLWVLNIAFGTDTGTWTLLSPSGSHPSGRDGATLVLDTLRGRLLLFGGRQANSVASNEVWAVNGISTATPAWERLTSISPAPMARFGHSAVFDRGSGRMIVYGGSTPGAPNTNFVFGDAWILDGQEWSPIVVPAHRPVGRYDAVVVFSEDANRLIVGPGRNDRVSQNPSDLWLLSNASGVLPPLALGLAADPSTEVPGLDRNSAYLWRGISRDNHGAWTGDPIWRFTGNQRPTVEAGANQSITWPASATLAADPQDDGFPTPPVLSLRWTKRSGPGVVTFALPTSAATTASFSAPGTYELQVSVSDGMLTASDSLLVTAVSANQPPVVSAGPDRMVVLPGTATLNGTVIDDGPPSSVQTTWSWVSGPSGVTFDPIDQAVTTATFLAAGSYVLRLTANDGEALAQTDDVAVEVFPPHDLLIDWLNAAGMVTNPQTLEVSGTVAAIVVNTGRGPVAETFVVKIFEDRNANGAFDPLLDNVLGTAQVGGLSAYAPALTVVVPVSGSVIFRGNRVYGFVDSEGVVTESNEGNNYRSTLAPCVEVPLPPFVAVPKWSWNPTPVEPYGSDVSMTPVVADLDGNGTPEVIFTAHWPTYGDARGFLWAVDGATGAVVAKSSDPVHASGQIAVGVLDRSGEPSIVAIDIDRVVVFDKNLVLKWKSEPIGTARWGGPTLADLDHDGVPEIIVGSTVVNAGGSVRWTRDGSPGVTKTFGPMSIVADLNLDSSPEILDGSNWYTSAGDPYGQAHDYVGGFNAIGNFDEDPFPEVAVVSGGQLRVLEHDGVLKWGPVPIGEVDQGSWNGGPPLIADLDGDGHPEIGVAAAARYVVFNANDRQRLTVKWARTAVDGNSNVMAASAFDFDGDGEAEVLYRDQSWLWVFRGRDGAILFQTPVDSATSYENPIVADIDGDGHAEIVDISEGGAALFGVHTYESGGAPWMATRKVWNQHSYHVTNVNEDLTIPSTEVNSWQLHNSYRQNTNTSACALSDLTASYLRRNPLVTTVHQIIVRIGNGGGSAAPPVPVSFYAGDPSNGGQLLRTVQTGGIIPPGSFLDVAIELPLSTLAVPVWAVADDSGGLVSTVIEGDENNNAYKSRLYLKDPPNQPPVVNAGPDITVILPPPTVVISGTAQDPDLWPIAPLIMAWGLVSSEPQGLNVSFDPVNAAVTTVTFDGPGTYILELRASDGDRDASDRVTVEVLGDLPDLSVTTVSPGSFAVNPQTLDASGMVAATIHNGGTRDAGPFTVTAYEERDGLPGFDAAGDNALGSVPVATLAVQGTSAVYIPVDGTVSFAGGDVRVFADSAEVVAEQRENNNAGRAAHGCDEGGCSGDEPDLIPSLVRVSAPSDLVITARIGNAGGQTVPAGVQVDFYNGDPESQRDLLGSAMTAGSIPPDGFADVELTLPTRSIGPIYVVADSKGDVAESVETNNTYNSRVLYPPLTNGAPVVNGFDQVVNHPDTSTTMNASVTDPEGDPLTLEWRQLSGPTIAVIMIPTVEDPVVTFSARGIYVFRLEADDGRQTSFHDVTVHVDPPNAAPVALAGPDASIEGARFGLQGSSQDDGLPRNATVTPTWTEVPVANQLPAVISSPNSWNSDVTFAEPGTYTFKLDAFDTLAHGFDTVTIEVTFINHPPVVTATAQSPIQLPVTTATIGGTYPDDGLPLNGSFTYRWRAMSGPSAVSFGNADLVSTTATFADPGIYVLRLTISDGELSAWDDVSVLVEGDGGTCTGQVAALTEPASGVSITKPTVIRGTVTSPSLASWQLEHRLAGGGSDWTRFGFGTTPVTTGDLAELDTTLLLNGLYDVRLKVTNTGGCSVTALTQVVVRDNLKVGQFTVSFVDMEVPVAGMPLQVTRTYDSRDKRPGDFGVGWRLDISNVRIEETGIAGAAWEGSRSPGDWPTYCLHAVTPKVVTVTMPNGRVLEFDARVTPSCQAFIPPAEVVISYQPRTNTRGSLVPINENPGWVAGAWPERNDPLHTQVQIYQQSTFTLFDPEIYALTLPDGRRFVVSQAQGLQTIRDLNGNVLTVTPNGITSSSGPAIVIERDENGRIESIKDPRDPLGHAVVYGFASDDLQTVTDREGNVTTFTYDPYIDHHLASIKDPMNRTPIRNDYDDNGRIKSHTDAFNHTIVYQHDIAARQEIVTDRNGHPRLFNYDDRGNVTSETDQLGKIVTRTFDARNNRLTESVPHDPGTPNPATTVYTYTPHDEVETVTDPDSDVGHPMTTRYHYNDRGQVEWVRDPKAVAATYPNEYYSTLNTYDAATGNLLSTTDAEGSKSEYTYWPDGNVKTQKVTDVAHGNTVLSLTKYEYTGGLLSKEENWNADGTALLRWTEFLNGIYGVTRRTTWRTPAPGQPQESLVTTYDYNANGQLLKTFDPDSPTAFTETVYNDAGQPWKTYDKSRRETLHEYDDMGRLTKTTYPGGVSEEITYWPEGQRKTFRDRMGNVTQYCYDDAGRLTKTRPPQAVPPPDPPCSTGALVRNEYDAAGRLVKTIDAENNATEYEYWPSGRRRKVIPPGNDPLTEYSESVYDVNGNVEAVRDPKGNVTTYEYDKANRRTKTKPPLVTGGSQTEMTTAYEERKRIETDLAGKITTFENDELGQLVAVTDALGHTTRYEYDEVGSRTKQTDAEGRETKFEYDKAGRETRRILPLGDFETKTYTVDGSLDQHTDFNGHVTDYDYDPVTGRLTRKNYTDPAMTDIEFTYYADGRRETVTDGRGATSYAYDEARRLKTLEYPDGRKLEYGFDHNGNRTSLKATIGSRVLETTFTYPNNRLGNVTDPAGRVYHHGYDPNGNRETLDYPNDVHTTYEYDRQNRLRELTTTGPGPTTVQSYSFGLGAAGNRESIAEAGGVLWAYDYDALYRLETETVTIGGSPHYAKGFIPYDNVGNRQRQVTTGAALPTATVDYTYDDRDRLMTETGVTGGYGYDANGNLRHKATTTAYDWDRDNRLTNVTLPDGTTVAHVYDADGNRVQTTTTPPTDPATVTNYLVDTSGSLSQVVAETDSAGDLKAYYVRGDELLAVMRPAGPTTWSTRFMHSDGIGSIRRLTDESGAVTDTYTYTAFGELIAHTGTDPQPYAFAGEPYDPNSGFQYHRARWMDPRGGRLVGRDPFSGTPIDPGTLHSYLYAWLNPTNVTDPSGRVPGLPAGVIQALIGRRVHNIIGADFGAERPGFLGVERSISTILGIPRGLCNPTPSFCDQEPDLYDGLGAPTFGASPGEVYEIKPKGTFGEGFFAGLAQLNNYIMVLNKNDPTKKWHRGSTYVPPGEFYVPDYGGWYIIVNNPTFGVILYEAISVEATLVAIAFLAARGIMASSSQGTAVSSAIDLRLAYPGGGLP